MNIVTIDFETYYDKQFSLSKLTTEQYIRSADFEVIGVGVKINDTETKWVTGTFMDIKTYLQDTCDWSKVALLAHNTMFDGAILSWVFDIHPKLYLDTLCMARALHGVEAGGSLKALAERYNIGEKGTEVINALGKRRGDFTQEELARYGDYCINDVELTHTLFSIFMGTRGGSAFPAKEIKLIDITLRMFVEPVFELDTNKLQNHLVNLRIQKEELLKSCGLDKKDLMSNPKFAKALEAFGVAPPTKISLRTGKETFAFAKNDEDFKKLQEHEDLRVQTLVSARLGVKSTLEETRTERFLDIALRGKLPVPVKYYAAHTGRWGGSDKINLQNLPSRGENAKVLKSCIVVPKGHTLIQADSAQIEARVLAWLAEQDDLVSAFAEGEDVYRAMAANIYQKSDPADITEQQRFVGKTTILGCGYGMGVDKFMAQLKLFGVTLDKDEAHNAVKTYRDTNYRIPALWQEAQNALTRMCQEDVWELGRGGLIRGIDPAEKVYGMVLPSGLRLRYEGLTFTENERGLQFSYKTREGEKNIYGGKVIENVCQALARCIIGEQILKISNRYPVLLTVHDSVVTYVPDHEVDDAAIFVETCMCYVPDWAEGLPVRGEIEIGKNYGDCTKWKTTKNPNGPTVV